MTQMTQMTQTTLTADTPRAPILLCVTPHKDDINVVDTIYMLRSVMVYDAYKYALKKWGGLL